MEIRVLYFLYDAMWFVPKSGTGQIKSGTESGTKFKRSGTESAPYHLKEKKIFI